MNIINLIKSWFVKKIAIATPNFTYIIKVRMFGKIETQIRPNSFKGQQLHQIIVEETIYPKTFTISTKK